MNTVIPPINVEYLNQRMNDLGFTDEYITFKRSWISKSDERLDDGTVITKETEQQRDYKIFEADEEGNIIIRYFDLKGQPYRWKKEDTKMPRDYIRKRLREPKGNMKYYQEAGSGQFPFFNPGIIEKYAMACEGKEEGHIEALFLVEGEIKSFKGYLSGIDIIGLPSIHGFYNGDVKGKMHEDIQEVVERCKVKKIVFLVDADILTVKWEEGKDLAKRPNNFYGSIKSFRESLQLLLDDPQVPLDMCYFMHINPKYLDEAKGLDDLICKYPAMVVEICDDLLAFQFARKYFTGFIINDLNKDVQGRIFRHLGLTDEQEFYKTYRDFIGAREFKFKRKRYQYDQEAKEVKFVRHEDADKYMRIGPDWVKVITKLNKHGEKEEEIVPWKISEITRDYKKYHDFLDQVQKYDDFCNEPNWNGAYKRVHEGCFNLCEPLPWKPKEGEITASRKFLKHIFQGKGDIILDDHGQVVREEAFIGDQFTVALDYLTILFKHPKQMLPVPILVSEENGTGKSTFLKWLQIIFKSNMCILGNDQFKMKFNVHYITKFIISIDEGFLEVDKKAEKERLKQLVTADSVYVEAKGMNVRKIPYYGKLMICSNDADRVMKIDDGESRWFVVKVPVIPKDDMDPDLELKLKGEVEAWLHYLQNRQVFHPRTHRLWFSPENFITEQFKVIVETTKNRLDRVFEDWIREQFSQYRLATIKYSISSLTQILNDHQNNKYKVDKIELRSYLHKKGVESEKHSQRFKSPYALDQAEGENYARAVLMKDMDPTFPYIFRIENWLSNDEIKALQPLTDPITFRMTPPGSPEKGNSNTDDLPF